MFNQEYKHVWHSNDVAHTVATGGFLVDKILTICNLGTLTECIHGKGGMSPDCMPPACQHVCIELHTIYCITILDHVR